MAVKKKNENNTTLTVLVLLFIGVFAGIGIYHGFLELISRAKPEFAKLEPIVVRVPIGALSEKKPLVDDKTHLKTVKPKPASETTNEKFKSENIKKSIEAGKNKEFRNRLILTSEKRDELTQAINGLAYQLRLLAFAGIKEEYRSRISDMNISQQAIDTVQDVFNHYLESFKSIQSLQRYFLVQLVKEYDKILLDHLASSSKDYQAVLNKRPAVLGEFERVIDDIKSVIGENFSTGNKKIANYIDQYLERKDKDF